MSERVERYWELKQAKRWDEIYDQYLDPTVKNDLSQEAFIGKRRLAFDIVSYTVPEVREAGDEVTVTVTNEANIPVPAGQQKRRMIRRTVSTADDWVRRDGVWYVALSQ